MTACLGGSAAAGRVLAGMLYGVKPTAPHVLAGTAAMIVGVMLAAR